MNFKTRIFWIDEQSGLETGCEIFGGPSQMFGVPDISL